MSINQNKAFAVKNASSIIIERNGIGKSGASAVISAGKSEIQHELETVGYRSKGSCAKKNNNDFDWVGFNQNGDQAEPYVFCVAEVRSSSGGSASNPSGNLHYYKIKTFYQFDIPVFNNLFQWTIEGTTKAMM